MKVLVTGAGGFIGRHVVSFLREQGDEVRALVHTPRADLPDAIVGDVRDETTVRRAVDGVETVIHLAARVHARASPADDEVTHRGTARLVQAAVDAGVERFVFVSTVAVYGLDAPELCDETVIPRPVTSYGTAKLRAEEAVMDAAERSGLHASILRPANVYGVGCKGNLPLMIRAIESHLFPPPPRSGSPRSFVAVEDLARACRMAAVDPAARMQRYNVVDDRPLTVRELYELVTTALGRKVPRWETPRSLLALAGRTGDLIRLGWNRVPFHSDRFQQLFGETASRFIGDKIRADLGFEPQLDLEQALPRMLGRDDSR